MKSVTQTLDNQNVLKSIFLKYECRSEHRFTTEYTGRQDGTQMTQMRRMTTDFNLAMRMSFIFKRFTLPVILRSDSDEESRPIAQLFSQLYVTEILRHSVPLDDNACGSLQVE